MSECVLQTYSFLNVSMVLDGKIQVRGYWEGDDAVVVSQNSDLGVPLVGADGEALLSITSDRTATITLRLKSSSPTHAWLRQRARAMKEGNITPFPIRVFDINNEEGGAAPQALIIGQPDLRHGAAASVREWRIFAGCWEPTNTTIND